MRTQRHTVPPRTKRLLVRESPVFYRVRLLTSVAEEFAVGRRWLSAPFVVWTAKLTVTLASKKENDKKKHPATPQLEHKRHASSSAKVSSFASNSGSTTSLASDRRTAHTSGSSWALPGHTTKPTFIPSMPDNTAAVPGKSLTDTSTTPVRRVLSINDSTTAESTKLSQSPRKSLNGAVKVQPTNVTAKEAYEALHVAIDYCRSKPVGYLTIKEGVLLGKFEQRLERCCGLLDTR